TGSQGVGVQDGGSLPPERPKGRAEQEVVGKQAIFECLQPKTAAAGARPSAGTAGRGTGSGEATEEAKAHDRHLLAAAVCGTMRGPPRPARRPSAGAVGVR